MPTQKPMLAGHHVQLHAIGDHHLVVLLFAQIPVSEAADKLQHVVDIAFVGKSPQLFGGKPNSVRGQNRRRCSILPSVATSTPSLSNSNCLPVSPKSGQLASSHAHQVCIRLRNCGELVPAFQVANEHAPTEHLVAEAALLNLTVMEIEIWDRDRVGGEVIAGRSGWTPEERASLGTDAGQLGALVPGSTAFTPLMSSHKVKPNSATKLRIHAG